ncbi:phage tail protein [Nisaea sp.]|uniref:phage tail protein n=1 Tax=Nisaea sp. TaxID=2024842 RepID=UPI003B52B5FD
MPGKIFVRPVKRATITFLAAAAVLLSAAGARATCGPADSVYIGSVCTTAADFCPPGYLPMKGQPLSTTVFQPLYSLLGCRWGGDCKHTFYLPDMRGRSPVGTGTGPGLTKIELGQTRGAETHELTVAQLPKHSHVAFFTPTSSGNVSAKLEAYSGGATTDTPSAGEFISGGGGTPVFGKGGFGTQLVELDGLTITGSAPSGTVEVGNTGESAPFAIQGPVMALTYCINNDGLFPSRG